MSTKVFDRVAEVSASGELVGGIVLEWYRLEKPNSVDPNSTPYRRDIPGNGLALISWPADKQKDINEIRKIAGELVDIVHVPGAPAVAYGNYSAQSFDQMGDFRRLLMQMMRLI